MQPEARGAQSRPMSYAARHIRHDAHWSCLELIIGTLSLSCKAIGALNAML